MKTPTSTVSNPHEGTSICNVLCQENSWEDFSELVFNRRDVFTGLCTRKEKFKQVIILSENWPSFVFLCGNQLAILTILYCKHWDHKKWSSWLPPNTVRVNKIPCVPAEVTVVIGALNFVQDALEMGNLHSTTSSVIVITKTARVRGAKISL